MKGKWKVSLRSLVDLKFRKGLPKLVIHEQYEGIVKWSIRILTAVGIVISVISIPSWYISLSVAVALFLIQQFLEKSVFEYTSIYVQPMPDFTYDSAEWKGMAFAIPAEPRENLLNVVGCAFASLEYARKFFTLISSWNYDNNEDRENNICLSFIIESDSQYSTYVYPNKDRKVISDFFKTIEEKSKYEKYGKEHQRLIMQMTFCKLFPYSSQSQLNTFIKNQDPSRPFWLKPFLMDSNGQVTMLYDEASILKFHYKYAKREDLTKTDFEYMHGKSVMKK